MVADFRYSIKRFLFQGFIPVTKTIALASGVLYVLMLFLGRTGFSWFFPYIFLYTGKVLSSPWTLLTYPFFNLPSGINLLFAILWLWFCGGTLERTWGSKAFGVFVLLVTITTGLVMMGVDLIFGTGTRTVYGLWLPLVGITWAWAEIYPGEQLLFWGIIPMRPKILAWLTALLVFLGFPLLSLSDWLFALASLSGILIVHLFIGRSSFFEWFRRWMWRKQFPAKAFRNEPKRKPGRKRLRLIK